MLSWFTVATLSKVVGGLPCDDLQDQCTPTMYAVCGRIGPIMVQLTSYSCDHKSGGVPANRGGQPIQHLLNAYSAAGPLGGALLYTEEDWRE
jgi:hypothetical protein